MAKGNGQVVKTTRAFTNNATYYNSTTFEQHAILTNYAGKPPVKQQYLCARKSTTRMICDFELNNFLTN